MTARVRPEPENHDGRLPGLASSALPPGPRDRDAAGEGVDLDLGHGSAEARVAKLNRFYAVSSGVNAAIVRLTDLASLFEEVCHIAVEQGGLEMAWVGWTDGAGEGLAPLSSWGGDEGFREALGRISGGDSSALTGSPWEALRTGRSVRCEDLAAEPEDRPLRSESLQRGYRCCAAFPLKGPGQVRGVLTVYGGQPGYLEAEEMEILSALADNLSFAVQSHHREAKRLRAENELRMAEERFRQLAENISEVFWIVEPQTRELLYVSPAYETIWGRTCASAYESPQAWLAGVHPEDRERMRRQAEGERYDVVYRILRPDGSIRWIHDRAFPVRNATGELSRVVGTAQDITEWRNTEDSLRESEERYRGIVELSPNVIFVNRGGRIEFINAAGLRLLRAQDPGQVLGRSPFDFFHPELHGLIRQRIAQLHQKPCTMEAAEERMIALDGEAVPVEVVASSYHSRGEMVIQVVCRDITERVRAEAETQQLADRLTTMIESLTEGFFTVDREWRFTYVNREAERLLRQPRSELLGRNLWSAYAAAQGTRFQQEYERAMRDQVAVSFEGFYAELGAWFGVRAFPSTQGLAVYFRDVTEQRSALETLRISEERFRLLAKATNDAIWDWDLATDQVWWNEGYEVLFGYRRGDFTPTIQAWAQRVHPDDREAVVGGINRSITSGVENWSAEYRFQRKDRTYAYVLDRGHVIRNSAGQPLRMVGSMTDLTQRKEAASRLVAQAALLDAASDAIILKDLDGRILYWNRSAELIYGWKAAEVEGKDSRGLLHPDPARFDRALASLMEHDYWRGELPKLTKDGRQLTMDVRWTLVRDEQGAPKSILAINTDITERKRLEAQLLRAQRMESIGTLAGGIAHDFNNLLAPILMAVDVLELQLQGDDSREMLATLRQCAQRGADLVRQVLSFARGVEGQRILVNPLHLLREIQKIIRETFPKSIDFRLVPSPSLWPVDGDPTQLHQVLMNLCVNARDAMPNGGVLTITLENVALDETYAGANPESKPGNYVRIDVVDTGVGIPPEIRERIFEPFFTTKELGKGTGLGLSTSLAIVRSHGGFIHVYSEPGHGTHFKAYLPASASVSNDRPLESAADLPQGRGELVLVVDDEESIREIARRTLERFGYRVLLAGNGAEAVAHFAARRSEVAVVLTDMAMPVMDGPSTIVALKSLDPRVRIIASSGLTAQGGVAKVNGLGIEQFIPKPYTAATLLTALARILRGNPAPPAP